MQNQRLSPYLQHTGTSDKAKKNEITSVWSAHLSWLNPGLNAVNVHFIEKKIFLVLNR